MAEKKPSVKRFTTRNTKEEMLKAYNELARELEEARTNQQKPEERIKEIAEEKQVEVAETIEAEGVPEKIADLKGEIAKMLSSLSERLETEVKKYGEVKKAIAIREKELREVYEIPTKNTPASGTSFRRGSKPWKKHFRSKTIGRPRSRSKSRKLTPRFRMSQSRPSMAPHNPSRWQTCSN